jgi:hypothetical protein
VKLFLDSVDTIHRRRRLEAAGAIAPLPEASQQAADQCYLGAAARLYDGLGRALNTPSAEPRQKRLRQLWLEFADVPGWYNIRSEGVSQTFGRRGEAIRMTIAGRADASCGWAYDLPEPIKLPAGAQLMLTISGTPGVKYFVDLMAPDKGIVFQTLWQKTPTEPTEAAYPLLEGKTVGQIILYTMTPGPEAHNDFRRVVIGVPGQQALVTVMGGR